MKFQKVNYRTALMICGPGVATFTNDLGQKFELAYYKKRQHGHHGQQLLSKIENLGFVYVFYHDAQLAYATDFENIDYFLTKNPLVKAYFFDDYLYFPRMLPEKAKI